ncbi:MAG TPA: NAD(P)/FAD-dependent oxidoreductase [Nitrososphaerales archaeon]|nr:NAD(P)/FAD-dependent oxidoreductase [Nitrososphaerales archaeon]
MARYDYDVIIAGGGMSGLLTAAAIGYHSKQRARVLVVDRNSAEEPGKKTNAGWICGDAASKKSINFIEKNIGIKYGSPELEHPVKGIYVYSPNHETKVLFEGEGYLLNRKLMPKRQVKDAKGFGVEFMFGTTAEKLIAEDGYVRGVQGRGADGKPFKASAKMVVDASGSSSVLRKFNPVDSYIEREIEIDDMEATGRYILEFDRGKEDETYFTPDYCLIHLDQEIAPAGYAWVFPKGENKVNIGLGVSKPGLDRRNKKLGKSDNLQTLIDQYVKANPSIKNWRLSTNPDDEGNEKGNWQVPVRRQNDCMVANGFAVVGDAAWMPRPLDAGGMGPAMYASMILGKVVARAIEANDVSQEGLWAYNSEYMQTHGYQMASFEVLRRYLQTVTNEQIDFGMKHFLTQEDIDAITERRHPKFNAVNKLNPKLLVRAAQRMELARGLRYTADMSESLVNHNLKYPTTPKGFPEWKKQIVKLIGETKTRFNPAAS